MSKPSRATRRATRRAEPATSSLAGTEGKDANGIPKPAEQGVIIGRICAESGTVKQVVDKMAGGAESGTMPDQTRPTAEKPQISAVSKGQVAKPSSARSSGDMGSWQELAEELESIAAGVTALEQRLEEYCAPFGGRKRWREVMRKAREAGRLAGEAYLRGELPVPAAEFYAKGGGSTALNVGPVPLDPQPEDFAKRR